MKRRALLLAIAHYRRAPAIPYVAGDVPRLRRALVHAGWADEAVQAHGAGSSPPGNATFLSTHELRALVSEFLGSAASDEELLIYFSGHGMQMQGKRLLVPQDYNVKAPAPPTELISDTDLFSDARRCKARSVIVLLDMCLEELETQLASPEKSLSPAPPAQAPADSPEGPTVALVYSCASGERSGGDDVSPSCSAFTRAFAEALESEKTPGRLGDLLSEVRKALLQLRGQKISLDERRIVGRAGGPEDIFVKDDAAGRLRARLRASDWVAKLPEKSGCLWTVLSEVPGLIPRVQTLVLRTEEMVAGAQAVLPEQRWRGKDMPLRLLNSIATLLVQVEAPGQPRRSLPLTAVEAALLIAVPFAYEAVLAAAERRLAADGRPVLNPLAVGPERTQDPLWRAWRAAYESDDAVERQRSALADRKRQEAAEDVVAWHLMRFCHNVGELWDVQESRGSRSGWAAQDITELSKPPLLEEARVGKHLEEVVSPERLLHCARLMFAAFEDVKLDTLVHDGATLRRDRKFGQGREQVSLDEVKVVHLLHLGAALALDARRLPPIAAEHLGSDEAFTLAEMLANLETAHWQTDGDTLALRLDCPHQALDAALLEAVDELEAYRRRLQEADGEVAARCCLYTGFTAKWLVWVRRPGARAFDRPHLRFDLERHRVMELLMGQQLYRNNPELALRELYQNALDACRYRRAQEEYRRHSARAWPDLPPYAGQIDLRFGEDRGRRFVECHDNGVGMAERHLRRLFARAGQRFTDSHEYHLDRARWEAADVPFFPNSRFGIGVLSYFMLAEELEIESQRVGSFGGRSIRAHVLGSGSLFRPTSEVTGAVEAGGSRIRLYLKDRDADLAGLAQSVFEWLWLPEFMTTLQVRGEQRRELAPNEPTPPFKERMGPLVAIPESRGRTTGPRVFWCLGDSHSWYKRPGIILADGILVTRVSEDHGANRVFASTADEAQSVPAFLAVNLCEELSAQLSVDRLAVLLASDAADFARNMVNEYGWQQLFRWEPHNTTVVSRLIERHGLALDRFSRALFDGEGHRQLPGPPHNATAACERRHPGVFDLDAAIVQLIDGTVTILPEHGKMGTVSHTTGRLLQLRLAQLVQAGFVAPLPLRTAAEFAAMCVTSRFPAPTLKLLHPVGSRDGDFVSFGEAPEQLGAAPALSLSRLVIASAQWGASVGDLAILARALDTLGLRVPDVAVLDRNAGQHFTWRHVVLLSSGLDGSAPFLEVLSWDHVLRAMLQEGPRFATEIAEAARDLVALGLRSTPALDGLLRSRLGPLTHAHFELLRQVELRLGQHGGPQHADEAAVSVTMPEVLAFAHHAGLTCPKVIEIVRDLAALGLGVPDLERISHAGTAALGSEHLRLLSSTLNGVGPFVSELTVAHLLRAASAMGRPLCEVAALAGDLASLGVKAPDLAPFLANTLCVTPQHISLLPAPDAQGTPGADSITPAAVVRVAAKGDTSLAGAVALLRELVVLGVTATDLDQLLNQPAGHIERVSHRHNTPGLSALLALLVSESDEHPAPLWPPHLARIAHEANITLHQVLEMARDLTALGIAVPEVGDDVLPALEQLTEQHLQLLDNRRSRWARPQRLVAELDMHHLLSTAQNLRLPLSTVVELARDLAAAGMPAPGLERFEIVGPLDITEQHIRLLRKDIMHYYDFYGTHEESIGLDRVVAAARAWRQPLAAILSLVRDLAAIGIPVTFPLPAASARLHRQNRLVDHVFLDGSLCHLSCWDLALAAHRLSVSLEDLTPEVQELAALGVDVGPCTDFIQFVRKQQATAAGVV